MPDATIACRLLEQYWLWVGLTQPRDVFVARRYLLTSLFSRRLGVK